MSTKKKKKMHQLPTVTDNEFDTVCKQISYPAANLPNEYVVDCVRDFTGGHLKFPVHTEGSFLRQEECDSDEEDDVEEYYRVFLNVFAVSKEPVTVIAYCDQVTGDHSTMTKPVCNMQITTLSPNTMTSIASSKEYDPKIFQVYKSLLEEKGEATTKDAIRHAYRDFHVIYPDVECSDIDSFHINSITGEPVSLDVFMVYFYNRI